LTTSAHEQAPALTEDQAMQLIAFLASSAEITLQEPVHYGPLRLIDAVSRMIEFMLENGVNDDNGFYRNLKTEIDTKKLWCMWDKPAFYQFLRDTPAKIAVQTVERDARNLGASGEQST
jgi:hypothetical protein